MLASTSHVTISHPLYEPEVVIEEIVVHDEMSFKSWVPEEDEPHFIEAAHTLLDKVGRNLSWSEIYTLTTFNAKMAAASVTSPHFGRGLF